MKRYAIKIDNNYRDDTEGCFVPMTDTQIVAISDSKDKAKELILEAIRNVAKMLRERGHTIGIIEELNDGWRYRIKVDEDSNRDPYASILDNEYISYCEEFEEGVLGEIEV